MADILADDTYSRKAVGFVIYECHIVVDWTDTKWPDNTQNVNHPVVHWNDGRTSWIMAHRVEVINESR